MGKVSILRYGYRKSNYTNYSHIFANNLLQFSSLWESEVESFSLLQQLFILCAKTWEQNGEQDRVPALNELTVCGRGGEEWGRTLVQ